MNKPFSLLVKPSSADCNLHCTYCFYLDRKELYPKTSRHRMSDEVLDRMIDSYMQTDQPTYSFGWQGGEPTLMGTAFFRKVTELQKKYGRKGAVVANGLQTNATLITDEMAAHLAQYNFLVGVSIDGPAFIHDKYRQTIDGRGSHKQVIRGLDHLRRHKVEYNVLVLVTSANVEKPKEVYNYLLGLGANFHQYIPCVEFDEKGNSLPYSINGSQWGDFLCGIFEEWIKRDTRNVSIRLFDSVLTLMVDDYPNVCHMDRNCCQYFVVEHNGDIYPCDFFVQADLRLGSIMDSTWEDFLNSPVYRDFGKRKSRWNKRCSQCPYLRYCAGDCPKHRFYGGEEPTNLSFLCRGWEQFFEIALPNFEKLALQIKTERAAASRTDTGVLPNIQASRSRNDPCFCGSGKKFKHCHGRI